MRLVHRLSRNGKKEQPLFASSTRASKLFDNFRFVGLSFVTALSSYVYDTAIGGNVNAFLARIALAERSADFTMPGVFSDVFSLMKAHDRVLDDVLSACLLRSSQRAFGDLLRSCLDVLLEFGMLVGERARGRVDDVRAAAGLEELHARFRAKMSVLVSDFCVF